MWHAAAFMSANEASDTMHPMISSWNEVAEAFGQRLDAMSADQATAASPCADWNCNELVDHAMQVQHGVGAQIGVQPAEGDAAASWSAFRQSMVDAMSAEGVLQTEVETPFGARPLAEAMGIPTMDLLVHTWDLSRTIGHDETLPEAAVAHAFEQMKPMDAMVRGRGVFGDKVEVSADASLQDQFIAFTGRQP